MGAPWEQYQAAASAAAVPGPWTAYQQTDATAPAAPPPAPPVAPMSAHDRLLAATDGPKDGQPNVLERFGHGMNSAVDGIHQIWLEAKAGLSQPDVKSQTTGTTQAQDDLSQFTKDRNANEALYQQGRGPDAGFDGASLLGEIAPTVPLMLTGLGEASAGEAALSKIPTWLARTGQGAAMGGATAAIAPTDTGSMKDRLVNTLVGAATGGVAAPVAGVAGDKLTDALQFVKNRAAGALADKAPTTVINAIPEVKAAQEAITNKLRDQPMTQAQIDTLVREGQQQLSQTGELDAAALSRKANLIANGLTPTTANVTRDSGRWTMERNLQKLAQSPDEETRAVGDRLTNIYTGNDTALQKGLATQAAPFGSGDAESRAMTVMGHIDQLGRDSQKDVSAVYQAVKDARGADLASDGRNFAAALEDLKNSTAADPIVESATRKMKSLGMLDADGNLTDHTMTVTEAENLRQHLNAQPITGAWSGFGRKQLINALDSDVIGGLGDDAFQGSRAAAKARFDMLRNPAVQKALDSMGELNQGRTAQSFIKSNVISAPRQDVKSLLDTIGMMPAQAKQESMDALAGGVMSHLANEATIGVNKVSGTRLTDAMDAIGRPKLKMILGDEKYDKLESLRRAAFDATTEPDYAATNHSGSGTALLAFLKGTKAITGVNLPLGLNDATADMLENSKMRGDLSDALAAKSTPNVGIDADLKKKIADALARGASPSAAALINNARSTGRQQ